MPPLTKDDLAAEIGLIISEAIKDKERTLSTGPDKRDDLFSFLHEDDFEDIASEAADKAAELIERRLCTFNPAHDAAMCQICK